MKPLGMTLDLHVIQPTSAEDTIWLAVQEAIAAGMSPHDFRNEAATAWEHELREAAKHAAKELTR